MSDSSHYTVSVLDQGEPLDIDIDEVRETLTDFISEGLGFVATLPYTFETEEPGSWFDHEIDMGLLSEEFPDVVFMLQGVDNCSRGEVWRKYFSNGCVQRAPGNISFESFDESLLEVID